MKNYKLGLLTATLLTLAASGMAAAAQDPEPKAEPVDPKTIWPASLDKLAGKYVFMQVASPGGLWERAAGANGKMQFRQVSINEVPAALREKLTHAELTLSDVAASAVEASERTSPSGRGKLRFYSESATGKMVARGLPGLTSRDKDNGSFSGPVVFHLEFNGHSNPSVSGVLQTRIRQEMTWGAATLDYADLAAEVAQPDPPAEGAAAGAKGAAPAPAAKSTKPASPGSRAEKPAPGKDAPVKDKAAPGADAHDEAETVLTNARILRSGVEIFVYVEWEDKDKKGLPRLYNGTVRLIRAELLKVAAPEAQSAPATPPAVK